MKRVYWVISIFVVTIMCLHILPLLQELSGKRQTLWPFMAWGMYRYAYPSDKKIIVKKIEILARTESGNNFDVEPMPHPALFNLLRHDYIKDRGDIPLGHFGYTRLFLNPMLKGDRNAAKQLANLLNQDHQDLVNYIKIHIHIYEMRGTGIEKIDSSVIAYNVNYQ